MSKIPEFGKVVFQYIPRIAEDPFSRPALKWKWVYEDLPDISDFDWLWLDPDPDEDQVLGAVAMRHVLPEPS